MCIRDRRYGDVLNLIQADETDRVVERKEVPLFDNKAFREDVYKRQPLDRDRAIITLVDSNLQRENILPSERAFAYKMKSCLLYTSLQAVRRSYRAA